MPSTTTTTWTAVDILRYATGIGQHDLWAESLEGYSEDEGEEISRRTVLAINRGYLCLEYGILTLTRKGSEYLRDHGGPCPCRRCSLHDDPAGCLYRMTTEDHLEIAQLNRDAEMERRIEASEAEAECARLNRLRF